MSLTKKILICLTPLIISGCGNPFSSSKPSEPAVWPDAYHWTDQDPSVVPQNTYGGITPEVTWSGFTKTMAKGDLEETLKFFDPSSVQKYQGLLQVENLVNLGNQLSADTPPDNCTSGLYFTECYFSANSEPVQFVVVNEKGQLVWKIKNF